MPAFALNPDGTGYLDEWTPSGSPSYTVVADSSDASYLYLPASAPSKTSAFTLSAMPDDAYTVDGSVTWNARCKTNAGYTGTKYAFFRYSATNDVQAVTWTNNATFQAVTKAYALAPGGGAWTPAVLNATEIGIACDPNVTEVWCAKLQATGNYTADPGGCAVLMWALFGALVGGNLTLLDVARLARARARLAVRGCRVLVRPDEYGDVLRWMTEYRHPIRVFL